MASFNFALLILGTFLVSVSSQSAPRPVVLYAEYPVNSNCGGVLTSEYSAIAYKTDVNVSSNERCVWTISTPSALGYTLDVLSLGLQLQTGQTGITATCLSRTTTALTSVSINGTGGVNLLFSCNTLILTFFSGSSSPSRGFILMYKASRGSVSISSASKHYLVAGSQQPHIRYPLSAEANYTNNELSTFVFPPPSNLYSTSRKTLVAYARNRLEGTGCADIIRLYRFSPSTAWTHTTNLCGSTESAQWTNNDAMLAVFRSDGSIVNRGFHIARTDLPL
ncbi:unnamed protein product [Orchesella dallaii]|uniref:CUB domain-containing protein n=1 Tax=Orchesella dallaii TaxID=48710 RepID=A0ABP1RUK1_9HEXA